MGPSDPRREAWRTCAHVRRSLFPFKAKKRSDNGSRPGVRRLAARPGARARGSLECPRATCARRAFEAWQGWKSHSPDVRQARIRSLAHLGVDPWRGWVVGAPGERRLATWPSGPILRSANAPRAPRTVTHLAHVGGAAVVARARRQAHRAAARWRARDFREELAHRCAGGSALSWLQHQAAAPPPPDA